MRVLFEIVHPADVHLFKHVVRALLARGDEVVIASRRKDVALALLDAEGLAHTPISTKGDGPAGLLLELLQRCRALVRLGSAPRVDVIVSNNSPCGSHAARALGVPSLIFDDTEIHWPSRVLGALATEVHVPSCFRHRWLPGLHRYDSYPHLAYVHPDRFVPDPSVADAARSPPDAKLVLLRFVSWTASHDLDVAGPDDSQRRRLVELMRALGAVLISAEIPLPADLERHRWAGSPRDLLHLVAGADLVIGESATLAAEAACLGTPAVYLDDRGRGFTDDLEARYGLCFRVGAAEVGAAVEHAETLLAAPRSRFVDARDRMLADKVDMVRYQLAQIDRLGQIRSKR